MEKKIDLTQIPFDNTLKMFLLKGAQIIDYWQGQYQATILIRLPKGERYVTQDIEFEYLSFQVFDEETMYHAVSYNGTKREVIKKVRTDHYEDEFDYKRIAAAATTAATAAAKKHK